MLKSRRRLFSLELNEEQLKFQNWVHEFAENVVRPAAHEWDEREETPWPIIQEAAQVGIYGPQFLGHATSDPTGLMLADRDRGAVLGRRRHRHGDLRLVARASPRSPATARREQIGEWLPQCFGTPTT